MLVRSGEARMSLVHGVGRGGSSVEGLGGPLAVAVEAVAVSDAVSKAETLSRPVGGGNSVSGVDGNSSVEGLGAPLAVVATVVEAGVETRDLLVRSGKARMGLADGVLGVSLVAVEVVAVLESGDSAIESISIGLSAPLAVAGVELGPLLERSSGTRVGLADSVSRGKLVSVHHVAVLKGGGKVGAGVLGDHHTFQVVLCHRTRHGFLLSVVLPKTSQSGILIFSEIETMVVLKCMNKT